MSDLSSLGSHGVQPTAQVLRADEQGGRIAGAQGVPIILCLAGIRVYSFSNIGHIDVLGNL